MVDLPEFKRAGLLTAALIVALGLIVGCAATTDPVTGGAAQPPTTVAQPAPNPTPVETVEPVESAGGRCVVDEVVDALRVGVPDYDYAPAGSYFELASQSDLVTGRMVAASRSSVNGSDFIELVVADVFDLDRPRPDIDVIAYRTDAIGAGSTDPLDEPVVFDDVYFSAFLTPWSGVRGGWNPGIEGLYVSCGSAGPLHAVIEDAAGPGDPTRPARAQLAAMILAERAARDAAQIASLDGVRAIRDAMVQFGRGEALAIEEIPLEETVALGLGSDIDRLVDKDVLRDPLQWFIERRDGYAEFAGPFSALQTLADGPATEIVLGTHPHCAGDPIARPPGFENYVQASIQPAEGTIDSCIQWFAVDLFLDPTTGAIGAVTLALFGP